MGLALSIVGYLLGSVLPAVWLVRRHTGKAPWELEDNPGTAGVWRLAGPFPAALTFLFDVLKGALPVYLGLRLGLTGPWLAVAAASPVVGHNWSAFNRFRGGRGLASAAGALLVISWSAAFPALVMGVAAAMLTKWVPTAGLVGFPAAIAMMIVQHVDPARLTAAYIILLSVAVRQIPWLLSHMHRLSGR